MTEDKGRDSYRIKGLVINTGRIVQAEKGWLLNPCCLPPITLLNSTFEMAEVVKQLLEQSHNAPS